MGTMRQYAPYPEKLDHLVTHLEYRKDLGWDVRLDNIERDHDGVHSAAAGGLTLIVTRYGRDTYRHERMLRVAHYFPVPAATYDRRSWQRWLFDRLGDVDTHERMEDFVVEGKRPYAPHHQPGHNPYTVYEVGTYAEVDTDFRGHRVHSEVTGNGSCA